MANTIICMTYANYKTCICHGKYSKHRYAWTMANTVNTGMREPWQIQLLQFAFAMVYAYAWTMLNTIKKKCISRGWYIEKKLYLPWFTQCYLVYKRGSYPITPVRARHARLTRDLLAMCLWNTGLKLTALSIVVAPDPVWTCRFWQIWLKTAETPSTQNDASLVSPGEVHPQ